MWYGINSNEFATCPKDTPDPFITYEKSAKIRLGKKSYSKRFLAYLTPLSDPVELFGTPPSHLFGSEDYGTGCSL